jgi:membrane protease YdiL (CAAX protease family)
MLTLPTILLFGGGLSFCVGLWSGRCPLLLGGGISLGALFAWLVARGNVHPAILPALAGLVTLAWALATNRLATPTAQFVGWFVYVLVVLLLGFHWLPGLDPVLLPEAGSGAFRLPPEKIVLLGIVPPLVRVPVESAGWPSGSERPGATFALLLAMTLLALIPLALLLDEIRPGWTTAPVSALMNALAYNLVFVCVLEESFFRGIVQNALMRWARQCRWPWADGLGWLGTSVLFGAVHLGGGAAFALLATLAGLGYGAAYYLTRRIHYAVLLHFAVNAVHQLAFAPTAVS